MTQKKSDVIELFSLARQKRLLEAKLKREFEEPQKCCPGQSFREDVYSVLSLSEWSDDVVSCLVRTPNLLQEVTLRIRDDQAFLDFFDQRVREVVLELIEQ